jgi:hypothetical protein
MAAALYDALEAEYCPAGESAGHLILRVWRPDAGVNAPIAPEGNALLFRRH